MHRINTPDGRWRQSKFLRVMRSLAYTLIGLGGFLLAVSPLVEAAYGALGQIMAWFLWWGGLIAASGAATVRWYGEFVGLPLIGPAFAILGILIWRSGYAAAPYIATANLLLLLAFSVLILVRWRVVLAVFRIAEHHAPGDGGRS
jgi:hypothetical protein